MSRKTPRAAKRGDDPDKLESSHARGARAAVTSNPFGVTARTALFNDALRRVCEASVGYLRNGADGHLRSGSNVADARG
jgi:hypothetical protein